jgi:hypothetical protein
LLALWIPLVIFGVWWITLLVYLLKAIGNEADANVA